MADYISDIAFSDSVKKYQEKEGSRSGYQRMAESRDWQVAINDFLREFILNRDSFYIATANEVGQPYVQHRGGPKGFLKILGDHTIGFADYAGNRQYISAGNLQENTKVSLFLMDYPNKNRIKIWGEATIIDSEHEFMDQLTDPEYDAQLERAMIIKVVAWDRNCPQHITPRYTLEELEPHLSKLKERISELEEELEGYKKGNL